MLLEDIKRKTILVIKENPVDYIGIFGSFSRGEAGPDSDVDFLVKFKGRPTFSAYLKLEDRLREVLGRKVDLVTEGGVNKFLRPYIERDLKIIYGQRQNIH